VYNGLEGSIEGLIVVLFQHLPKMMKPSVRIVDVLARFEQNTDMPASLIQKAYSLIAEEIEKINLYDKNFP
jgi:hypothetical protein